MQTDFSLAQLADPDIAASEKILRACVHCGFCTATCPTYVLLGDALDRPQIFPAEGERRMRVTLLSGCAQQVVAPEINEATVRLLTRFGCEVVVAPGSGCCGALLHHLGDETPALALARANIDAWERVQAGGGLDAVVANASGCGTMLKDYGFLLREDPAYAEKAARIAALARDVSEVVMALGLEIPGSRASRPQQGGPEV